MNALLEYVGCGGLLPLWACEDLLSVVAGVGEIVIIIAALALSAWVLLCALRLWSDTSPISPVLFALAAGIILGAGMHGCSQARAAELGLASWYSGGGTFCGDRTVQPMTAAHKSLPCGAVVRVTTRALHQGAYARFPDQARSVIVTIRDRGPFIHGRIIDLDRTAGAALGLIGPGVLPVAVERIR